MKTFDDRMRSILEKAKIENRKKTKRRVMAGTLISVFAIALVLVLLCPTARRFLA